MLGSSPEHTVMLAMLIPGAAAMTCWEQTETGVFRMGLLNQIESVAVLSLTMVVTGIYGTEVWRRMHVGPVSLWQALHLWPIATILFGKVRGLQRVASADRPIAPASPSSPPRSPSPSRAWAETSPPLSAVALATGVNLYFGARMLSLRLRAERSRSTRSSSSPRPSSGPSPCFASRASPSTRASSSPSPSWWSRCSPSPRCPTCPGLREPPAHGAIEREPHGAHPPPPPPSW